MKKLQLFFVLSLIMVVLTSCTGQSQPETPVSAPKQITDREGIAITVPEKAEKIISLGPAYTEILVELGLGGNIIAIDEYSVGLPGLNDDVPAFDMLYPDIEKLLALKPDLVLATAMIKDVNENPYKPLTDANVCFTYIPTSGSIEAIKADIEFIGQLTGAEAQASTIIKNMEAEITKVEAVASTVTEKKSVYFEISAAPYIYSFGRNVFLDEMIELIGAVNVFADSESWMSVSEEIAISKDPDVILTNVKYIDDPVSEIKSRSGWDVMKAVKNGDVYFIDTNPSTLPNHNIITALKQMARAIYPDKYN